ncbi:MAG: hypothetical protein IKC72_07785 [Clostridia bacterium]|nr:hypothetical protein [Clostridia bacterium]
MKKICRIFFLMLSLCMLMTLLALTVFATETESTEPSVLIVGETINPDTAVAYTLAEAWAKAEAVGTDLVEVVVKTNNDTFTTDFTNIHVSGKKTTLQLTSDVSTTAQMAVKSGVKLTIDVSGYTFSLGMRLTVSENNTSLTFRTSTAAGTVKNTNTSANQGLFMAVGSGHTASMNFISANNDDKLLTVESNHAMIAFGNGTKGTSKINFQGGTYKSLKKQATLTVNSHSQATPSALKINASDATFSLDGGFLSHNLGGFSSNVGAFNMNSAIAFDNCTFLSKTESAVNFLANPARLNGRYFGTLSFGDCTFTNIEPNFSAFYTYVNKVENEDGTVTYDTNYPYLPEGGTASATQNCTSDYYITAAEAGYDGSNRIFFHGINTFTGADASYVKEDGSGLVASNYTMPDAQVFLADDTRTSLFIGDGSVRNGDDLISYIKATSNYKKPVFLTLANDIELAKGATLGPNGDLTLDLKGHTFAMTATDSTTRFYPRGKLHIYSSETGGAISSASALAMFFFADNYSATVILGREDDPRENLTLTAQTALFQFSNSFYGATTNCSIYSANITTSKFIIKLNSYATKADKPITQFTFRNCDINIAHKGILSYNENKILSSDTTSMNNGIIAYGSYFHVEDSVVRGNEYPLFASDNQIREEGGARIPTFQGAYFGTVTFKNTHFEGVNLNFDHIYSDESNKLLNGANDDYVIPDEWDVKKQVTLLEGCTFDTANVTGVNSYGNAFTSGKNLTVKEGYVLARTDGESTFAILPEEEAIKLTWELPDDAVVVSYQAGAPVRVPALDAFVVTLNGNTYTPVYNEALPEYASENATYTTRYTGGATLSANYTLNVAIDFHAYIPATDEIVSINGTPVGEFEVKTVGAVSFYKITFADLAPKDAHKSKLVSLSVNLGEKTVMVDRYISLVGYAEAAMKTELDEKTKALVLHTMDYINKANVYFGGASVTRIEALLQSNGFTPYVWEEKNVKEIGEYENLRGAALDLNQTPGFVFYVRADYDGILTVNGVVYDEYSDIIIKDGVELKYIVVQVPAYRMAQDLTVTAGNDTLVYNLDTYIAGKAVSEPYAHALYGYFMACADYIA